MCFDFNARLSLTLSCLYSQYYHKMLRVTDLFFNCELW